MKKTRLFLFGIALTALAGCALFSLNPFYTPQNRIDVPLEARGLWSGDRLHLKILPDGTVEYRHSPGKNGGAGASGRIFQGGGFPLRGSFPGQTAAGRRKRDAARHAGPHAQCVSNKDGQRCADNPVAGLRKIAGTLPGGKSEASVCRAARKRRPAGFHGFSAGVGECAPQLLRNDFLREECDPASTGAGAINGKTIPCASAAVRRNSAGRRRTPVGIDDAVDSAGAVRGHLLCERGRSLCPVRPGCADPPPADRGGYIRLPEGSGVRAGGSPPWSPRCGMQWRRRRWPISPSSARILR